MVGNHDSYDWRSVSNFIFYVLTCVRRPAVLVALLLLVPLIFGSPLSPRMFNIDLPRVFSGDEPLTSSYLIAC